MGETEGGTESTLLLRCSSSLRCSSAGSHQLMHAHSSSSSSLMAAAAELTAGGKRVWMGKRSGGNSGSLCLLTPLCCRTCSSSLGCQRCVKLGVTYPYSYLPLIPREPQQPPPPPRTPHTLIASEHACVRMMIASEHACVRMQSICRHTCSTAAVAAVLSPSSVSQSSSSSTSASLYGSSLRQRLTCSSQYSAVHSTLYSTVL